MQLLLEGKKKEKRKKKKERKKKKFADRFIKFK